MKFKPIRFLLFFLILQSSTCAFSCDLKLVEILTAPFTKEQEFAGVLTDIASHTKVLSTMLADFLQKNQKYHFPPKNVNGQYLSSTIEADAEEATAFIQQFAGEIEKIDILWADFQKNSKIYPAWVNADKDWEQKCQNIESSLKQLKDNVIRKDFVVLHEFISSLYVSILSVLEPAQKDVLQKSLLAISGAILQLTHGIEQNRIVDIELASLALASNMDKLEGSLSLEHRVYLDDLKAGINELDQALKNEQLYLLVEVAGKIDKFFAELTKLLSEKYHIEKPSSN